jgi:dTDP-glucose 4,6-dehydratase
MKTILVTGGAGFIGSHFVDLILKRSEYKIIVLDKLTYAGKIENMNGFINNNNVLFVQGDICDKQLVKSIFNENKIDIVVNFAAESHVDNSISSPDEFMSSNIIGTFNLLNVAKKYWSDSTLKRFIQISTDEVYGSADNEITFDETSLLQPNSPYSASKASGDLIARSFFVTYKLPVIITRSSNNFGPRQDDEKLIPKVIKKIKSNEPIPVYGNGRNVRDWIYVEDNCNFIFSIMEKGIPGECYNISSRNEMSNLQLIEKIAILMKKEPIINFVEDRLGHDFRYSINNTKTISIIGNHVESDFDESLFKTINSYLN